MQFDITPRKVLATPPIAFSAIAGLLEIDGDVEGKKKKIAQNRR